jgi:hypothetical protein
LAAFYACVFMSLSNLMTFFQCIITPILSKQAL